MSDHETEVLFQAAFPIDRTLDVSLNLEGSKVREQIDAVILKALYVAPVFSDYFLVSERPTPAELSVMLQYDGDDGDAGPTRFPLISDDCLVVVVDDRIEQLLTIARTPIGDRIVYQVSFHVFRINTWSAVSLSLLHHTLGAFGVLSYPDSELIDKYHVDSFGHGATLYLIEPQRTRPLFLTRRSTTFSRKEREYLKFAIQVLSPFGLAISSDPLFREYGGPLNAKKLDIVAVPPSRECTSTELLGKNELGLVAVGNELGPIPVGLDYFLDKSQLRKPDWIAYESVTELGQYAKRMFALWHPQSELALELDKLRELGRQNEEAWAKLVAKFEKDDSSSGAESVVAQNVSDSRALPKEVEKARELDLDEDGYPVDSKDLALWSERTLGDNIVILPRARQALRKFQHPEPRRLAQALELLAGPKLKTYWGDRGAQDEVNSRLLSLRMRDGFSNAELLRGQFGDDYIVNYCGKPALLGKHLASIGSGFNDPRLIRIYYFYDKARRKIIVGWLPTHLPTSQS